jgi:multidrug efflux pump subunit AcrA (membrane-fusion protein)
MRLKTLILFMVIAALSISALSGCALLPAEEQLPTMPTVKEFVASAFNEVSVQRGNMVDQRDVTVYYKALQADNYQFDTSLKGQKIGTCHVEVGQVVKKGDLLLELDNTSLYSQIATQEEKVSDQNLKLRHLKDAVK